MGCGIFCIDLLVMLQHILVPSILVACLGPLMLVRKLLSGTSTIGMTWLRRRYQPTDCLFLKSEQVGSHFASFLEFLFQMSHSQMQMILQNNRHAQGVQKCSVLVSGH